MKAYHIMMFLLIFNLFGLTMQAIGLYNFGATSDDRIVLRSGYDLLVNLAGYTILALVGGIVIGAIIGNFLKILKSGQSYVYGVFTAVFWESYVATLVYVRNIMGGLTVEIIYVYIIFTAIVGYIFAIGLFQMVVGGFKSYE